MTRSAFAISAHPDDIEFMMAGTLLLLKQQAGYEIHYMTVANGCCGSTVYDAETIAGIRRQEAMEAAAFAGAIFHESLADDLEIFYDKKTLQRLAAVIREVAPEIILTQSTQEYMEDHMNTTRLVQTAAFARGIPNFPVEPPRPPVEQPVTVYHALPYGLRDPLRRRVQPGIYVDISEVIDAKREMLALHGSQRGWLQSTQGLDSYLLTMEEMSREVGRMSGHYSYAEGWTRHLHLGFCAEEANPLLEALPNRAFVVEEFERGLG